MIRNLLRFLHNIALVYFLYLLCRIVYVWEFWDLYAASFHSLDLWQLLVGGLRFDTAAVCYTNFLWALLFLGSLPWLHRRRGGMKLIAKLLYVIINALMLSVNLVDTVYSRYTGRRTTWTFFSEFANEGNLSTIFFTEVVNHWYLVLLGLAFIAALIFLYQPATLFEKQPNTSSSNQSQSFTEPSSQLRQRVHSLRPLPSLLHSLACVLLLVPLTVIGIRGGASTAVRPITISNANQYVNEPSQAAIVLNTPFSLIRTIGKTTFVDPAYFTPEELNRLYSPVHNPSGTPALFDDNPNVVVLIVESLAMEYVGFYNQPAKSLTPFLDSLISQSLTFRRSYANGRKSIDAMPSVLSSIPMFIEPFFVTRYSLNNVSSIAGELGRIGYTTAFYHGADNGSMGFQAFARTSGFQHYFGRNEYCADSRFGGNADFDGTWAIWDEEFLQYYAATMDTLRQPFMTALFTATSHHPFVIPKRYQQSLRQPNHPMYTCIRYTDSALHRFFLTASRMPWYRNTLFVITADHTNITRDATYSTPQGSFAVPIIFFDPSGRLPRGVSNALAQQIDIMPTLLGLLGYPYPYVAFGQDLLATTADHTWAIQYNGGIYQYLHGDTLYRFDGNTTTPYSPSADSAVRAIVQSYMQRMISNQLTVFSSSHTNI